jgi:hypothetical protein
VPLRTKIKRRKLRRLRKIQLLLYEDDMLSVSPFCLDIEVEILSRA